MYPVAKHVYMNDGKIVTTGFDIDKEKKRILGVKRDAMFINDDIPIK